MTLDGDGDEKPSIRNCGTPRIVLVYGYWFAKSQPRLKVTFGREDRVKSAALPAFGVCRAWRSRPAQSPPFHPVSNGIVLKGARCATR